MTMTTGKPLLCGLKDHFVPAQTATTTPTGVSVISTLLPTISTASMLPG